MPGEARCVLTRVVQGFRAVGGAYSLAVDQKFVELDGLAIKVEIPHASFG
jgi:hypothetical protein